ncbi:unnamed protein product, partial [Owenia fusiformis]
FCRNPTNDPNGLWCYTNVQGETEYCHQATCNDPSYVGCYVDSPVRDLTVHIGYTPSKSACIETCRNLKYAYAGLQYSRHCFCGTMFGKYGISKNGDCNMLCGDGRSTCG